MIITLLIIIAILLLWDLYYSRLNYKIRKSRDNPLPDEKYYELKYSINLLKSVAAILIFIIGFLGFDKYSSLEKKVKAELENRINKQNKQIDSLSKKLDFLTLSIDSLSLIKSEIDKLIQDQKSEIFEIGQTIDEQKASVLTSDIFVIENLKIYLNDTTKSERNGSYIIYFQQLKTSKGNKLPQFSKPPIVSVNGRKRKFLLEKVTSKYVIIRPDLSFWDLIVIPKMEEELFNLWISEAK